MPMFMCVFHSPIESDYLMNTHLTPSHGFALGSLVRPTFGDTSLIGEIVTVYADSTVSVYFDRPDAEARIHTAGLVLA